MPFLRSVLVERMDTELKRRLTEVAGAEGVDESHSAVVPGDVDAVTAVARICAETRTPMTVTSGPQDASGAGERITVSLHRLDRISVAAAGLTVRAEAGATLDAVRDAIAADHLAVVGLPASAGGERVGALIARGLVARRSLSGIEAVLPTGEVVSAGGAALKDVVGYDLASVLLGSTGRLALIVAATFRLEPAQAQTPSAEPAGTASSHALVARAFDPDGLLRPQS